MECACIEGGGEEYAEVNHTSLHVARKQHKCIECKRAILPGERYELNTMLWEGDWIRSKTCLDCRSVTNAFFCGFTFTQVWEDLRNSIWDSNGRFQEDKILELTPAAREKVFELIAKIWASIERE